MTEQCLETTLDENRKLFRQLLCGSLPDEERSVLTQLIKCLDAQEHADVRQVETAEVVAG